MDEIHAKSGFKGRNRLPPNIHKKMTSDSAKTPEPPDTPIHFLFYYEWKEKSALVSTNSLLLIRFRENRDNGANALCIGLPKDYMNESGGAICGTNHFQSTL